MPGAAPHTRCYREARIQTGARFAGCHGDCSDGQHASRVRMDARLDRVPCFLRDSEDQNITDLPARPLPYFTGLTMSDIRGSGRTARQMQAAPPKAVFVWCNGQHYYPRALARHLGRSDIRIVSPSWVGSGRSLGCADTIVVDHAAVLSARQHDEVCIINDYAQRQAHGPRPTKMGM
jgi:hypothetical protein